MRSWRAVTLSCLAFLTTADAATGSAAVVPDELRCEYLVNPLGIDVLEPRLSWILRSAQRGQRQSAYQIQVATSPEKLTGGPCDLWDTGNVDSDQSTHVVYEGNPLRSQMRCTWRVRAWDRDGNVSPWSEPAFWSMGLLKPSAWKARWIGWDEVEPEDRFHDAYWIWHPQGNPAVSAPVGTRYFRRELTIPEGNRITAARLIITADNAFQCFVNGKKAGKGDNFHVPAELDLAGYLHGGKNVLAVAATNVGDRPTPAGVLGILHIEFADGDTLVIGTDRQWRTSDGPAPGWKRVGFNDSVWDHARELGRNGTPPWGRIHDRERTRLPARMLRREFRVDRKVDRATAYVCGLGLFELYLNGRRIGDHAMDPGLTMYTKRCLYVTFDVTEQVNEGANTVGVILGNGRFLAPRRSVPWASTRNFGYPKLMMQISIEYADGSTLNVGTDETWKITTNGPIRANNEYDGEEYDARMEMPGWSEPGFDDAAWTGAQLVEEPGGLLQAQMIEPMRVTETIRPVAITNPKPGTYIVDMGQTFYGTVRLKVSGPRGIRVQWQSAYSLRPDGTLKTEDNRTALCKDIYTLKGEGTEAWAPRFRGQGYRRIEVTGFPGVPGLENFEGLAIHTDMESMGSFTCSNPLINRIYNNVRWGQRMYLRSLPIDPDRDERLGWMGDQAMDARSYAYNFNAVAILAKWLADIRLDQLPNGHLPDVAPAYYPVYKESIDWPSVMTIIPELLYDLYGDRKVLRDNYECMRKWMGFVSRHQKPDFTIDHNIYGDWCDAYTLKTAPVQGATSKPLIATAYHYNNCRIMARIARLLGKTADGSYFGDLAEKTKAGFLKRFFNPQANTYESETQCSYVVPLALNLVPPEHKPFVVANLVNDILVKHKGHLSVGLIGMQWLMQALSDSGHSDVAYTLAAQTSQPSWGYMISKGATTIWERWDTDTRDPGMNSEALLILVGDLNAWFYQTLAGIHYDRQQPGFKHIILRPHPVGDLQFVKCSYRSAHGIIVSDWKIEGGAFHWNVIVPANTTATAYVPALQASAVLESGKPASDAEGVQFLRIENGRAVYELSSGTYQFRSSSFREK